MREANLQTDTKGPEPCDDAVSRQAAIDALHMHLMYRMGTDSNKKRLDDWINSLPSAQGKPFNLPEIYIADGYDTIEGEDGNVGFGVYVPDENQIYVAGDVEGEIRARALLHEICHWVQAMCGRSFDEDEANEFSDIVYDALPSAQETHEERTETHACDCISRAEAIELKPEFLNPNVNRETKEQTAIDRAYARGWNSCNTHWIKEIIEDLPSVQPETAKRIVGKSRDGMTLWYQCDMCNEPVDAQDNFCSGCGRRLVNE